MSGTSIDSVDAVLVDFSDGLSPRLLAHHETAIPADLRADILALTQPGNDHVDNLGRCDAAMGKLFALAVQDLLAESGVDAKHIAAIGSHGQTVRHRPPQRGERHPFSLQIGDPNIIAAQTGITTVADFRRRDLALGGQGAPLAPAFHNAVFSSTAINRAVLNLGGIANITWLPREGTAVGFDTGPGNVLMDSWCHRHRAQPYDSNGDWAATGNIHLELLKRLLTHPFLALSSPKSTGREEFHVAWLDHILTELPNNIAAPDIQATLLEFTARSATDAIKALTQAGGDPIEEVYLCGGGAYNGHLVSRLKTLLNPTTVANTSVLGIRPKLVESTAFAWLAKRTLQQLPGNLPTVTGARDNTILGGVYFA